MQTKKIFMVLAAIAIAAIAGYVIFAYVPSEIIKEPEINFSEGGYLSGSADDGWSLVYEEPGAPGLSVFLNFSDSSKCYEQEEEKSCSDIVAGERVEVKGYEDNEAVEVKELSLVENEVGGLQEVKLYYYNSENDKDENGNIMCSRSGVVPISAILPAKDIVFSALNLLIQGNIPETAAEQGVATEYPLEGFSIESLSFEDGLLTITFNDPNNSTVGGSCRTGILWYQIEQTALQFDGVEEVRFQPETLFQP